MVFRLSAECSAFELEKDLEIGASCGNCTRMNSLEVSQVSVTSKSQNVAWASPPISRETRLPTKVSKSTGEGQNEAWALCEGKLVG